MDAATKKNWTSYGNDYMFDYNRIYYETSPNDKVKLDARAKAKGSTLEKLVFVEKDKAFPLGVPFVNITDTAKS